MSGWVGFWIMMGIIIAAEIITRGNIRRTEIECDSWNENDYNDEDDD